MLVFVIGHLAVTELQISIERFRLFFIFTNMKKFFILLFLSLTVSLAVSAAIKVGQTVTITANCVGAIDESTIDKITKDCSKGSEVVLRAAVKQGYAIVLSRGSRATVVSIRIGKVRIKLSDGKMVWVLYKHVK